MVDTAVVDHLLSTTRSVRRRLDLDRPVEREVIFECLRLAVQAPTAANSQSWRWLVITDAGQRAELGRLYRAGGEDYLVAAAAEAPEGSQQRRVAESGLYLAQVIERVPVHVIPCVKGRPSGETFKSASLFASIIPAAWSFQLALRSRGLGSVWTTLHLHHEREAAELLGIPENFTQVGLIPVAYTTDGDFTPAVRPPVEEITYWGRWGTTI